MPWLICQDPACEVEPSRARPDTEGAIPDPERPAAARLPHRAGHSVGSRMRELRAYAS